MKFFSFSPFLRNFFYDFTSIKRQREFNSIWWRFSTTKYRVGLTHREMKTQRPDSKLLRQIKNFDELRHKIFKIEVSLLVALCKAQTLKDKLVKLWKTFLSLDHKKNISHSFASWRKEMQIFRKFSKSPSRKNTKMWWNDDR